MELQKEYLEKLNAIKTHLQDSEEYQTYLDEEDEESYNTLRAKIEPYLNALYLEVSKNQPMQILTLEEAMMDHQLEGLYLDKLMSYSILRAKLTPDTRFDRSQDILEKMILFMTESSSFDLIENSMRLPVRMTFALSSNIWSNKVIEQISSKRAKEYLRRQLKEAKRDDHARVVQYKGLKKRYAEVPYQTAEVPAVENLNWKVEYDDFRRFLVRRVEADVDNSTLVPSIYEFLNNEKLKGADEQIELFILYSHFFELEDEDFENMEKILAEFQDKGEDFQNRYFELLSKLIDEVDLDIEKTAIVSDLINKEKDDFLSNFYTLVASYSNRDHIDVELAEEIERYSHKYRELSPPIACFKKLLLYFIDQDIAKYLNEDYTQLFENVYIYDKLAESFLEKSYREEIGSVLDAHLNTLMFYFKAKTAEFKAIKKLVSGTPVEFGFITMKEVRARYRAHRLAEKAKAEAAAKAES